MGSAAVIYVTHLASMAAFYEACFDLRVAARAPAYRALESPSLELTLVQVPPELLERIGLADPPQRRESTPIKLVFEVGSIEQARAVITRSSGRVDGQQWTFRGRVHCDFTDPEGNVGQLRALPRAAP